MIFTHFSAFPESQKSRQVNIEKANSASLIVSRRKLKEYAKEYKEGKEESKLKSTPFITPLSTLFNTLFITLFRARRKEYA